MQKYHLIWLSHAHVWLLPYIFKISGIIFSFIHDRQLIQEYISEKLWPSSSNEIESNSQVMPLSHNQKPSLDLQKSDAILQVLLLEGLSMFAKVIFYSTIISILITLSSLLHLTLYPMQTTFDDLYINLCLDILTLATKPSSLLNEQVDWVSLNDRNKSMHL